MGVLYYLALFLPLFIYFWNGKGRVSVTLTRRIVDPLHNIAPGSLLVVLLLHSNNHPSVEKLVPVGRCCGMYNVFPNLAGSMESTQLHPQK